MVNLTLFDRMPVPGRESGVWGYLGNMFVLEHHRRKGVAAALTAALLEFADRNDLVRVVLNPSEMSVPLYRKLGFHDDHALLIRHHPDRG